MIRKVKFLFCIFALLNGYTMYSQIKQDTILSYEQRGSKLSYFVINNKIGYEFKWNKKLKEYVVFKDTLQLSSTLPIDFHITSFFMDKNSNELYFGGNKNYWTFDLKCDSLKLNASIKTTENYIKSIVVDNKLYYTDYLSLYIKNITENKFIDSINNFNNIQGVLINEFVKFPNTDNVYLMLANLDDGDISDEQYYVYDERNKIVKKLNTNNFIKENISPETFGVKFYDLSGDYVFLTEHILNSNFEIYNNRLYQANTDIYGFVIVNQEIKQLLLKSNLDSDDSKNEENNVLIPFIPDPNKEKAMYEIYENVELTAQDLQRFDAFDLRLLRNMIFAKHNYAFKDKFLQAYFNMYSFYGYQTNRLMDVNKLLTTIDKKNLELIQQASKQKEK